MRRVRTMLGSNAAKDRLIRTIIQGIIGVIIANLDLLIDSLTIPGNYKPVIVMLVMAVLSPIMEYFGDDTEPATFGLQDTFEEVEDHEAETLETEEQ